MSAIAQTSNRTLMRVFAGLLLAYGNGLVLTRWPGRPIWGGTPEAIGLALLFTVAGSGAAARWTAEPHAGRFLMRCGARLLPGLAAYVVIAAFVAGPMLTQLPWRRYLLRPETRGYLQNILLHQQTNLPGVFLGRPWAGAVNPMLWSLLAGLLGCVAIPVLWRAARHGRVAILAAAAVGTGLTGLWATSSGPWRLAYHADPAAVVSLLAFFMAAVAVRSAVASGRVAIGTDAAILGFVANGVAAAWIGWISLPLLWLTLPVMVAAIERQPVGGRIADPSLGIFLYGFPIQQAILAGWPADPWPIPTCLGLSLAAGLVSWFLVERPALIRAERLLAR